MNAYLDAILKKTNVSGIFINTKVEILFFTPSIVPLFSLIDADINRPLKNFAHSLDYPDLIKDCEWVIKKNKNKSTEVQDNEGNWYLVSLSPSLNNRKQVNGALITIQDINQTKKSSETQRKTTAHIHQNLSNANIGVWEWDVENDVLTIDDTTQSIFKVSHKRHLSGFYTLRSLVHPEDKKQAESAFQKCADKKSYLSVSFRIIRQDKSIRYIATQAMYYFNVDEHKDYISGIWWDITERVRIDSSSVDLKKRPVAVDDITDGWFDLNLKTHENIMSPKFKAMLGYDDHEIPNTLEGWQSLLNTEDLDQSKQHLKEHLASKATKPYLHEIRYNHKNGSNKWFIIRGRAIKDTNQEYTRVVGTHTDITELKLSKIEFNELAFKDSLTGLPNRLNFMEYLPHAIERAKRNETNVSVFFIDIDDFKKINDTLGHNIGDELLIAVTTRLEKTRRKMDFLARLGGDEFAVVLEDIKNTDEITQIASRYIKSISHDFIIGDDLLKTTLSIGISVFPQAGKTAHSLLKQADMAMYKAKEKGKNNFVFFDEKLNQHVKRQNNIENQIRTSISSNEFELVYQPQYELKTKKIIGMEALIRWPNESLDNPPPSEFIPIVELTKMIIPLGEWILEKAIQDYQKLVKATKNKGLILAVNISMVQLADANFVKNIEKIVKKTKVDTSILTFELTETSLMQKVDEAREHLMQLQDMDINIALDDFGTGYSSMSYLKFLPINHIKIDRSFVNDIHKDESDMAIINAIVSLSSELAITTVAEGVETKEQLNYLRKIGCDQVQGYYLARPMTLDKLIKLF